MLVKAKILIIDANESTRSFMRYILSNSGYRTAVAGNVDKARELIADENFGVIVIDPRLPDVDGLEFIKEIRGNHSDEQVPILAITQFFNMDKQEQEAKAGVTHWIVQPVAPNKLASMMSEIAPAPETYDDEMINQLMKNNK